MHVKQDVGWLDVVVDDALLSEWCKASATKAIIATDCAGVSGRDSLVPLLMPAPVVPAEQQAANSGADPGSSSSHKSGSLGLAACSMWLMPRRKARSCWPSTMINSLTAD